MKVKAIILVVSALVVNLGHNSTVFAANNQSVEKSSFVKIDTKYSQPQNNSNQQQVAFRCLGKRC